MRELFLVFGLCAALAACEPRIYIDEPLETSDASALPLADAGAHPDASAVPLPRPDAGAQLPDADTFDDAEIPPPDPAPQLGCAPEALDFGVVAVGDTKALLINCTNSGDADLFITQIQFIRMSSAFTFQTDRGTSTIMLPPAAAFTIEVRYSPLAAARDSDALLINSNDPDTSSLELEVLGEAQTCLSPMPVITVLTPNPCVGMPVELSSASSTAGSGAISWYQWSWLFTPSTQPLFIPSAATSSSSFVPSDSGTHIIALDLKNDCGAQSTMPGAATIDVAAICP